MVNEQQWQRLMKSLEFHCSIEEFGRICAAYSEPQRAYHTLQHLTECLDKIEWVRSTGVTDEMDLVEIALWYHDVVYQPTKKNNELKSADWALSFLTEAGLNSTDRQIVYESIMATCHGKKPQQFVHQLVVDIDLSILAASHSRFSEYESQVRKEYKWVPGLVYRKKRIVVLEGFLSMPSIYNTELFIDQLEDKARDNIQQFIRCLT